MAKSDKYPNIFINKDIYPNAGQLLRFTPKPLVSVKDDCLFILDTNVLLLPYTVDSKSISEIRLVYESLKASKRLILPAQVVREFVKNRPEKLKDLFSSLRKKQNSVSFTRFGNYPILTELVQYQRIIELESEIQKNVKEYRKLIEEVIGNVQDWSWNDPVSEIYKEIFSEDMVIEVRKDDVAMSEDLQRRISHGIPPGFKDQDKPDNGIGDLIIWQTILELSSGAKDIVFVTHDSKNDWFYRSENETLYPRFELLVEFERVSEGGTLHIIKLSQLLELNHVNEEVVNAVKHEEEIMSQGVEADHPLNQYAYAPRKEEIGMIGQFVAEREPFAGEFSYFDSLHYYFKQHHLGKQFIYIFDFLLIDSFDVFLVRVKSVLMKMNDSGASGYIFIITPESTKDLSVLELADRQLKSLGLAVRIFIGYFAHSRFYTSAKIE